VCGRYTLASSGQLELGSRFGLRESLIAEPRFNICPGEAILAIVEGSEGPAATRMSWGLVPHWAKDPSIGARMINARSETAGEKQAFADALMRRRCLIPADGFYEWAPGPSGGKQPWHFTAAGGEPFAFAGISAVWHPPGGGEPLRSCSILTRAAGPVVAPVHDREPVIVAGPDAERRWLRDELDDAGIRAILEAEPLVPLTARPVGQAVNDARFDGPECLAGAPPDPQGTLFETA
jgi:putative SOS response-associated peptidase YedK